MKRFTSTEGQLLATANVVEISVQDGKGKPYIYYGSSESIQYGLKELEAMTKKTRADGSTYHEEEAAPAETATATFKETPTERQTTTYYKTEDALKKAEERKKELEQDVKKLEEAKDKLGQEVAKLESESLEAKRRELARLEEQHRKALEEKARLEGIAPDSNGLNRKEAVLRKLSNEQLRAFIAQKEAEALKNSTVEELEAEVVRRRLTRSRNETE